MNAAAQPKAAVVVDVPARAAFGHMYLQAGVWWQMLLATGDHGIMRRVDIPVGTSRGDGSIQLSEA